MKAVVASRPTKCSGCGQVIEPGEHRVDDTLHKKFKDGRQFLRVHYHYNCHLARLKRQIISHENRVLGHGGGRPALDLTSDQKEQRRRVLSTLANAYTYWVEKLPLQTPLDQLTLDDLEAYQKFQSALLRNFNKLKLLGGIPKRYQEVDIEKIKTTIIQLTNILSGGGIEPPGEIIIEAPEDTESLGDTVSSRELL